MTTVADGSQLPRDRIILEKGKRTAWGTVFWRGRAAYRIAAKDAGLRLRGDPFDVFDIHVPALCRDPEAAPGSDESDAPALALGPRCIGANRASQGVAGPCMGDGCAERARKSRSPGPKP